MRGIDCSCIPQSGIKGLIFCLVFFPGVVFAKGPPLEEFAGGYELITDGSAALYRVPLPAHVYATVTRADLGDVRVFNRNQEPIPHAIRYQQDTTTPETLWTELAFFPLTGDAPQTADTEQLEFTLTADGKIIHLQYKGAADMQSSAAVHTYIVDLSSVQQDIDALEFELTGNTQSYTRRMSVESSDDLNSWSMLVSNAALSRLEYGGHVLEKKQIDLPGGRPKYLRLIWRDAPEGLTITGVRAALDTVFHQSQRIWSGVTGVRSKDQDKQLYDFDTGGVFPIEWVNIHLPEDNTLIEGTLRSRPDAKAEWRQRHRGLYYNLHMQGTDLEQGPINIGHTVDRYWQLEVSTEDGMGAKPPKLKFAWRANELYFLARGEGPFTLAFGNAGAQPPGKPIDAFMQVLSDEQESSLIQAATLGQAVTLKGEAALKPGTEIPWQRILLWGVLVAGVLVIATMAFRLFRQLNHSG